MNYRDFTFQVSLRLIILFLFRIAMAFSMALGWPVMVSVLLGIIILSQGWNIFRFVNRTNQELVNFITGLRFNDYMQTFTMKHLGGTFKELEQAMNLTVTKVKDLRAEKEKQAAYFQALVQHMPLPLFFVFPDNRIEVLNNATRRAFNVADITNVEDLTNFGAGLARDIKQIKPGESLLSTLLVDGTESQYIISATSISMDGKLHKLISMQNVQSQLDATELATWQNLLRVTSHEILNSLSPVSSLAKTTQGLVADYIENHEISEAEREELTDINDAIDTLVRRSEGLTGFVQSYRQLTRMPPPKVQKIELAGYLKRLESLIKPEWEKRKIRLEVDVNPKNLTVSADEGMVDQALINLLKNAADALKDTKSPKVKVRAYFNKQNQVVIEVEDNGPGIGKDKQDQIFVPFFTTKQRGSGVGLTLVKYIMLSHGGNATYQPAGKNGALFRLSFN